MIRLGTDNDANIRHDGSNMWIQNSTGYIYMDASSNAIRFISQASWASGAMAAFNNNGSVQLYYDAQQKFHTTASGINVVGTTDTDGLVVSGVSTFTGAIDANGDLDVDGHTNLDNLNIAGVTTMTGNLNLDYRLIHNGDADTYMEFPAANRIRFATANQNRLEIREDGRIVTHGYDGDRFIFNHDMGQGARNIQIYAVSDTGTWHSFVGTNLTHDGTNYIKPVSYTHLTLPTIYSV